MNISFDSITELRKRLTPALRLRIKLLKKDNNLSLYEMVNDILNKEVGDKYE